MRIDISLLPALAAIFVLVFARIGTMVMLLPGLGEASVPTRVRLILALLLTAVLLPMHSRAYSVDVRTFGPVMNLLGTEILTGALLGLVARFTISALQVAGSIIAQQVGLGFVTAVDPTQGQQGVIIGSFLTTLGLTLVFATDVHHLAIGALAESYELFHPGEFPDFGDASRLITEAAAAAFRIGVQLSAPFLIFGLVFNIGLGVLSRLMPQMQVFFVGVPLSILGGFVILLFVVGGLMSVFLSHMESVLQAISLGR